MIAILLFTSFLAYIVGKDALKAQQKHNARDRNKPKRKTISS